MFKTTEIFCERKECSGIYERNMLKKQRNILPPNKKADPRVLESLRKRFKKERMISNIKIAIVLFVSVAVAVFGIYELIKLLLGMKFFLNMYKDSLSITLKIILPTE